MSNKTTIVFKYSGYSEQMGARCYNSGAVKRALEKALKKSAPIKKSLPAKPATRKPLNTKASDQEIVNYAKRWFKDALNSFREGRYRSVREMAVANGLFDPILD